MFLLPWLRHGLLILSKQSLKYPVLNFTALVQQFTIIWMTWPLNASKEFNRIGFVWLFYQFALMKGMSRISILVCKTVLSLFLEKIIFAVLRTKNHLYSWLLESYIQHIVNRLPLSCTFLWMIVWDEATRTFPLLFMPALSNLFLFKIKCGTACL